MPSYKVPVKKQKTELTYDDRMQAIAAEYTAIGYTYVPTNVEKEALIFERYKQKFKHAYTYTVSQLYRIKLHNDEYLVYRVEDEVVDSNDNVHQFEGQRGWHTSPIAEKTGRNEFGEPTDTRIVGQKLIYEIPYDKEAVRELLSKSKSAPTCLCVGRGSRSPPDIISSNPQAVFNEEEFIESDFEDLFAASVGGFLRTEPGGVKAYQQSKQSQQAQAQAQQ